MALQGLRRFNSQRDRDKAVAASVARSRAVPVGKTLSGTKSELKSILGIEGDAVGTLNEQELHTKTLNGGFF
jgi:hypothetical protein